MGPIVNFTDVQYIKKLISTNKHDAIAELALVFKDSSVCSNVDDLIRALKEREDIMSTGIGFGIAIPHAKIKSVKEIAFAIGISKEGIDFNSIDGEPVHLIILVAAGDRQHKDYLRLLSNIMAILKNKELKGNIINSNSAEEIIKAADEMDADFIAMSTHGRSGLSRLALGSVTERVLRGGNRPILTVRASGETEQA